MSQSNKVLLFTNGNQQLVWNESFSVTVVAHLWGAGGGGGYCFSYQVPGGKGSGGAYSQKTFTINPGDVITVSPGGGGLGGLQWGGPRSGTWPGPGYLAPGAANGYSGGWGSGPSSPGGGALGTPGGGGGGGGATVLLQNNIVIAVAGGGGGGASSAGDRAPFEGQDAPGPEAVNLGPLAVTTGGFATPYGIPGSNGYWFFGSGGGGGGHQGGAAGPPAVVDSGQIRHPGFAGAYGHGLGDFTVLPTDINAAHNTSPYYIDGLARGGTSQATQFEYRKIGDPGTAGFAVLELQAVGGTSVFSNGGFQATKQIYIKIQDQWQPVNTTWIKQNGVWSATKGQSTIEFVGTAGDYGFWPVTCISIIVDVRFGSRTEEWDLLRATRPLQAFWVLSPRTRSDLTTPLPDSFVPANKGYYSTIGYDYGQPFFASDWFEICNLGSLPAGSVVEFGIDYILWYNTSRSVLESYKLFVQRCQDAGLILILTKGGSSEYNWVQGFLTNSGSVNPWVYS